MSELTQVMNMDFAQLFINIIIILVAFVFVVGVLEKFSVIIGKPVKWIKKKDDDHKILMDAVATMKSMQETHAADKKEVNDKNDNLDSYEENEYLGNDENPTITRYYDANDNLEYYRKYEYNDNKNFNK